MIQLDKKENSQKERIKTDSASRSEEVGHAMNR
ncbi:hypothetical protein RSAG8_00578, partial [Rhizoctonia solani AG-8 WAC10335]